VTILSNPLPSLDPSMGGYTQALLKNASQAGDISPVTDSGGQAHSGSFAGGKNLLVSFGNVMEAEFYAVAQNNKCKFKKYKPLLLAIYDNFFRGYRRGISRAANLVSSDLTGQVYTLAYADGFRDGYDAGYAAGWKDGFSAGNAAAWAQANVIISNLQTQVSNLQTQLNNANNDSGGGFWNNVGGILSDVGTAVGIIGSFF